MKAPEKFRIVLTGDIYDVIRRENVTRQIGWYLAQLLMGVEMPEDVLRPWRVTVEIEEDMDQGTEA